MATRSAFDVTDAPWNSNPTDPKKRIERGRARKGEGAPLANECLRFWRGDQYVYRDSDNYLIDTPVEGGRAPGNGYRMRETRNLLIDVVAHEVSASTQRVPAYDISPSTTDREDIDAAKLAAKAAAYGYDKWGIRRATVDTVTNAVVADEGFAWPYFDNTVGDPIDGNVSTGEICIRTYSRNEVMWEPGIRFDDSMWWGVEQAQPIEKVMSMPGYIAGDGPLHADANSSDVERKDQAQGELVLVVDYLERPTPKTPRGRWLTFANDREILPPRDYPCKQPTKNGGWKVLDEPVLHKLAYIEDPQSDRDMGLVRHLLGAQRTYNDCTNKQLEWKNLALVPQMVAPPGAVRTKLTNEPGLIVEAIPYGGVLPKWRDVPSIPPELSVMKEEAKRDIASIAAQSDIPNQVESGKGIEAYYGKQADRAYAFINQLAAWHSRLMRHCLYLVQRHYSEERLLKIRGRFGPESIAGFMGAHLRGQADVTVNPGSIEPRTRQWVESRVLAFADRGWISPQAAMAAINNGTGQALVESYELQIGRAHQIISQIRVFGTEGDTLPAPRRFENLDVIESVLTDWMLTSDFDGAAPYVKEAAEQYYEALVLLKQQKAMEEAMQQAQMAEQQGMQNAARPQGVKPMPDMPAMAPA